MDRQLCIVHANCQGDELARVLNASTAFQRVYSLERYTNYTREAIPAESLARCGVFLYQQLGPTWGDLASDALVQRIPTSATALCIPNMLFKGYWPFWTSRSPIAFGDTLLNSLIDEGAPKDVILRVYLHNDLRKLANLQNSLEETIAMEREKERSCCVRTVDAILTGWKSSPVFHTVNHPGESLLLHVGNGILEVLNLPPLNDIEVSTLAALEPFPSYTEFDLPIHPQVASFHGLAFGGPEHHYNIFGRSMTFAQYISRYIDCRLNGMDADFLSYLQLV